MGAWFGRTRSGRGFFFSSRFGLGESAIEIIVDTFAKLVDPVGEEMIGPTHNLIVHRNILLRLQFLSELLGVLNGNMLIVNPSRSAIYSKRFFTAGYS